MTDYFTEALSEEAVGAISSLGLAHIGDAVYELLIRTWLCRSGRATAKGLHNAAVTYVSAPAQAAAAEALLPHLSEHELAVYRRGRNTRVNSVPRGASHKQYHAATGLETLVGYLYLRGEKTRINELFALIVEGE